MTGAFLRIKLPPTFFSFYGNLSIAFEMETDRPETASSKTTGKLSSACYLLCAAGCLFPGLLALRDLLLGYSWHVSLPLSGVLTLSFRGGGLSAYFVVILSILGFCVSVYSVGYARHSSASWPSLLLYGIFVSSMYAVFYSANIPAFLVSWETMSLSSYFLVVSDTKNPESARAGLLYAVMTHIGTAFIMAAFMVMYFATGSLEFTAIKAGLSGAGGLRSVIFVLALTGFGTKAGIIPLHTWLPRAHPAAPSNVSALMSGVMIKSGIYGILLVSLDILGGQPTLWWGVAVLSAGAVSSVMGIMHALMERDIKRLLAYSSVENVGIILLGIGASMIFSFNNLPSLAGLALAAALYHVFNHAVFKGLLFMGAGSAVHATGTKNMEEMGGLIKRMPWTGLFFLVGSVAICALPPFNGFMSEWLTFQSLIMGIKTSVVLTKTFMLLAGAALALTGALAASSFVKAFGITFLGVPRSQKAEGAHESSASMLLGMGILSLLCLLLGIFPGYMLRLISNIPLPGLGSLPQFTPGAFAVTGVASSGVLPIVLLGALLAGAAFVFAFPRLAGGRRKTTKTDPWDCGIRRLTPRMQYTATAFTHPLRRIFKKIYKPRKEVRIEYIVKPFFTREIEYRSEITPLAEAYFYRPFVRALHNVAHFAKRLQSGNLQLYLGYILGTLVVLLVVWG